METISKQKMLELYENELVWELVPIGDHVYGRTSEGMDSGMKVVRCKI